MMRIFLLIALLIFCSCSSSFEAGKTLKRKSIKEYYFNAGGESYFLPDLPRWANFSSAGRCQLSQDIRYLNMDKLKRSLKLTHHEALQLQLMYNFRYQELMNKKHIDEITLSAEEKIFFDVAQKIQQKIYLFNVPRYPKVSILWLDSFSGRPQSLKKIFLRQDFSQGHPIVLSLCHGRSSLENYLSQRGLGNRNIRLVSSGLVSPYGKKGAANAFVLSLGELLGGKKQATLFVKKGWRVPKEIKGQYKIKYIKEN